MSYSRVLLMLPVILLTGCAEDDPEETASPIRRSGSWGRIVEGPSQAERELNAPMGRVSIVLQRRGTPLACGETILLRATVKENVDRCEGYSFSVLYREALRHVDELADHINCPEGCEKNPYIVYQKGRCGDGDATVTITMAVTCRNPSDRTMEGLPIKSDAALRQSFDESDSIPDASMSGTYNMEIYRERELACPLNMWFWIDLKQAVESCENVDYRPTILRAKEHAMEIWQHAVCPSPCTKKNLKKLGITWNCRDKQIQVRYFFEVPCSTD